MSNKKDAQNEISLEEKLTLVDEIIEKLEDGNISLEDAFNEYSKGVKLVGECNASIDRVEKKVKLLMDGGMLEDFE